MFKEVSDITKLVRAEMLDDDKLTTRGECRYVANKVEKILRPILENSGWTLGYYVYGQTGPDLPVGFHIIPAVRSKDNTLLLNINPSALFPLYIGPIENSPFLPLMLTLRWTETLDDSKHY